MACLPHQSHGVGFPSFIEEEIPMTMQIALRAKDGLVVASDTKIRTTEQEFPAKEYSPFGIVNSSKVRVSKRHDILVALEGGGVGESDPAQQMVDYLSSEHEVSDGLSELLGKWGNRYFEAKFQGQKHEFPLFRLLVVNPPTGYLPFWKLRVRQTSTCQSSSTFMVNGNDSNSAIFWPEYFKCDKQLHDLPTTVRIAALTILMGSQLNPYGVGGLEIWKYDHTWIAVTPTQIETLKQEFRGFEESSMRSFVSAKA
jgi:hypothetical protein